MMTFRLIAREKLAVVLAAMAFAAVAGDSDPWVFDDSQHPTPVPAAVSVAVSAPACVCSSAEAAVGTNASAFDTRLFTEAVSAVFDYVVRAGCCLFIR